ncbi:MAG: MoaD/ThiS family protein [Herpetosiphon sp.]
MATQISIPTALRQFADGSGSIAVDGQTVGDALNALTSKFPELGKQLFADGKLRTFVNVYVNDDDVRYLKGLETPLSERDDISIVPAIAGGVR